MMWVCSNPRCRATHKTDPQGHCPSCKNEDGSGWSTIPIEANNRRNRIDLHSTGEKAIRDALIAVEAMGADVRLTDAVSMLSSAQESVADFIDKEKKLRRFTRQEAWND